MNVLKKLPFSFYILLTFFICQTWCAVQIGFSIINLEELLLENTLLERNADKSAFSMTKLNELSAAYHAAYRYAILGYILTSVTSSIALLLFYWMYTKQSLFMNSSDNSHRSNSIALPGGKSLPRLTHQAERSEVLSRRLLSISEQEKASLARELHDELGSSLMMMHINLANALDTFGKSDPALERHLRDTLQLLKKTVDIKRRIVENLRPSMLDNLGLAASIRSYCEEIASRSGLQIDVNINGNIAQPDSDRSLALYRIVQESLTNTIKYAKATHVSISLDQCKDGIHLRISDNGIGIKQDALQNPQSHGIIGMRERAVLNGGSFTISHNKTGSGTNIDVFIPCIDL